MNKKNKGILFIICSAFCFALMGMFVRSAVDREKLFPKFSCFAFCTDYFEERPCTFFGEKRKY